MHVKTEQRHFLWVTAEQQLAFETTTQYNTAYVILITVSGYQLYISHMQISFKQFLLWKCKKVMLLWSNNSWILIVLDLSKAKCKIIRSRFVHFCARLLGGASVVFTISKLSSDVTVGGPGVRSEDDTVPASSSSSSVSNALITRHVGRAPTWTVDARWLLKSSPDPGQTFFGGGNFTNLPLASLYLT